MKGLIHSHAKTNFPIHDSLVRRVWIEKNKRSVVRVTRTHRHSCLFGAIDIKGQQIFCGQYDKFNSDDTFLNSLKVIHARFPKCYLFMDKVSPHYRSRKIKEYFE